MGSFNSDTVKAQKASAMRTYNMRMYGSYCLRVTMFLFFLGLFFSYYPVVAKTATTRLSFLNNQLYIFFFLNGIVLFVLYLSNASSSNTGKNESAAFQYRPDFSDEYACVCNCRRRNTVAASIDDRGEKEEENMQLALFPQPAVESEVVQLLNDNEKEENMQLALFPQQAVASKVVQLLNDNEKEDNRVVAVEENRVSGVLVRDDKSDGEWNAFCGINSYRRTSSERLRRESNLKTNDHHKVRELRRSDSTESRRRKVVEVAGAAVNAGRSGGGHCYAKSVEEMNNEEFRMTIEKFIAGKNKLLRDERISLYSEEEKRVFKSSVVTSTCFIRTD